VEVDVRGGGRSWRWTFVEVDMDPEVGRWTKEELKETMAIVSSNTDLPVDPPSRNVAFLTTWSELKIDIFIIIDFSIQIAQHWCH
jgi:hypothetical protein